MHRTTYPFITRRSQALPLGTLNQRRAHPVLRAAVYAASILTMAFAYIVAPLLTTRCSDAPGKPTPASAIHLNTDQPNHTNTAP